MQQVQSQIQATVQAIACRIVSHTLHWFDLLAQQQVQQINHKSNQWNLSTTTLLDRVDSLVSMVRADASLITHQVWC